ncbi:MAG: hypothetical protein JF616_17045 [Fibrobacteres bacterium]|nr:hypothetical protein [Fibrobacterota bacterium]
MQAGKVIELVHEWALRPERVAAVLAGADASGRHLLALVYAAEERGATEAELLGCLDGFPPSQALMLLGKLEQDLLLYSREGEKTPSYHGFQDLAGMVLPTALAELAAAGQGIESAAWIAYRHFLLSHLCHFLAQVALGSAKITQSGELHRKDAQELANRFAFGERLSGALADEEVQFLLHFAVTAGLVLQEDGTLRLSSEGKAFPGLEREEAWRRFAAWWLRSRVRGLSAALEAFAGFPAEPIAYKASAWANLLWIHSGAYRKTYGDPKTSYTWENLPRALQEMWLLGLVDFGLAKGRIAWVRPDREAMARAVSQVPAVPVPSPARPISLPNLETLVPLDAPLERLAQLELVALKSNDEFMGRWRFTKESVIKGLQAGLTPEKFAGLLTWLGFEAHARQTLLEWAATYSSTMFLDTLVLKVSDPVRFRELQEIPQFLELITEVIPGYGFSLSRQNKPRVRELLHHFGLVPGEDARRIVELAPVALAGAAQAWEFSKPDAGPPAYRETPGNLKVAPPQPQDPASQASREQELAVKMETLEGAIAAGKKVEFSYAAPTLKRLSFKPLLILKHKDPPKVIGIEADSGHRNEYVLEQMKALRVLE